MFGQLLAHLWGDYIFQSDWMAENKTKRWLPAAIHALIYTLCFLPLALLPMKVDVPHLVKSSWGEWMWMWNYDIHIPGIRAVLVIFGTHLLIDHFRLARYVVWAKNWMGPRKKWFRKIAMPQPYWTDEVDDESGVFHADGYNSVFAPTPPFWACRGTGYPPNRPVWLAVWLLIIADNILHLTINYAALRWL